MRPETCQICNHTHGNMCFLSADTGRWTFNPCAPGATTRDSIQQVSAPLATHKPGTDRSGKPQQQNKSHLLTSSLQSPGCSLLRPDPIPSFCPFVISNAHLFPLIKGIIIYNFLLKNQLCTLSIADRNSQLVTWLEKIDRNSSLWKEKKRPSKIIYRCKKPCCRTFSNYEDFQQCSKIKRFFKNYSSWIPNSDAASICNPAGFGTRD